MKKELLIAIPAYNEEKNIAPVIESLLALPIMEKAEILVVNDGSKDNTLGVLKNYDINVISHIYNLGYGSALKTAYKFAIRNEYDYLIQIDADGQHDPCNIENVYDALTSKLPSDVVIGSRFLQGSKTFKTGFAKKFVIWFFNTMIKLFTHCKITDPTSGLQGLNRKAFTFYGTYNNFVTDFPDANMVIQMLLNDFTVKEVPAIMHERVMGRSMHSGLKPIMYLIKMFISSIIVVLRTHYKKTSRKKRAIKDQKALARAQKDPVTLK